MVTQTTTQETTAETTQESTNKQPPSGRHFEAYRLVKVERWSTREAAKLLRISQTRVCQVVARVAGYLVDVTEPEDETRLAKQLAVARQVAAEEINYCKDRALLSFDTRRTLRTVKEIKDAEGKVTTVTFHRESVNESRFLLTIARLGKFSSTLPTCTLPIVARRTAESEAEVAGGDVELEMKSEVAPAETAIEKTVEPTSEQPATAQNPSEEDCSAKPVEQPFLGFVRPADVEAKVTAFLAYDESQRMEPSSELQNSETVHPAEAKAPAPTPRALELLRKRRELDKKKRRGSRKAG